LVAAAAELSPPLEDEPTGAVSAAAAPVGNAAGTAGLPMAAEAEAAPAAPAELAAAEFAAAEFTAADAAAAMSHTVCADITLALAAASVDGARRPVGLAAAEPAGVPELVSPASARTVTASSALSASSASLSIDVLPVVGAALVSGLPGAAADELVVVLPAVLAPASAASAGCLVAVPPVRDAAFEPERAGAFAPEAAVEVELVELPSRAAGGADFGAGFPSVAVGVESASARVGVPDSRSEKLLLAGAASAACGVALRALALAADALAGAVALIARLANAARDRPVRAAHAGLRLFAPRSEPCR
jgi:hypothetical protein